MGRLHKNSNWIMQGYATLADEAVEQMAAMGIARPTHVFLQAGVGAMARRRARLSGRRFSAPAICTR